MSAFLSIALITAEENKANQWLANGCPVEHDETELLKYLHTHIFKIMPVPL
jgi:hypothetical protein